MTIRIQCITYGADVHLVLLLSVLGCNHLMYVVYFGHEALDLIFYITTFSSIQY